MCVARSKTETYCLKSSRRASFQCLFPDAAAERRCSAADTPACLAAAWRMLRWKRETGVNGCWVLDACVVNQSAHAWTTQENRLWLDEQAHRVEHNPPTQHHQGKCGRKVAGGATSEQTPTSSHKVGSGSMSSHRAIDTLQFEVSCTS